MAELTFIEMVKNTFFTIVDSEVFTLLLFEIAIILVTLVFSKLMDKKVVRNIEREIKKHIIKMKFQLQKV